MQTSAKSWSVISIGIALFALFCAATAQAKPEYTVTDCGPIYSPSGINIFGEITGQVADPKGPAADNPSGGNGIGAGDLGVYINGKIINLITTTAPAYGYPDVSGSPIYGAIGASSINNFGEIVGTMEIVPPHVPPYHPEPTGYYFVYKPGQAQPLTLAPANIELFGLNDLGDAVGYDNDFILDAGNDGEAGPAILYHNGVVIQLPAFPGGVGGGARAINNRGQIVGWASNGLTGDGPSKANACLWQNGKIQALGSLTGVYGYSYSVAINDRGQVVGGSSIISVMHPFLWENGVMMDLGLLPPKPGFVSEGGSAVSINNLGEVIGNSGSQLSSSVGESLTSADYYPGPFLYVGGKMYDLNSLLVSNNGYTIVDPLGINDFGVILAEATRVGDSATAPLHTVLLTPVVPRL
jgi:probable HAF family extracellular repeat protein